MPPVGNSTRRARPGSAPCPRTPRAPCPRRSARRSCRASRRSSRSAAGTSACSGSRRCSSAHSFIASATASASEVSSGSPLASVCCSRRNTSLGRRWRWTAGVNTLYAEDLVVGEGQVGRAEGASVRCSTGLRGRSADGCAACVRFLPNVRLAVGEGAARRRPRARVSTMRPRQMYEIAAAACLKACLAANTRGRCHSTPSSPRPAISPLAERYESMQYRRCGRSGLKLPAISLGLWQNFGDDRPLADSRAILRRAFDLGITHFDLANNYGPPYGSAEINFGRILREDFAPYRDELIISTKAGYDMWPGPYGEWGSRKYLLAQPRPEPAADAARVRRHLLLPPLRSRHAARGDDGRAGHRRALRARPATSGSPPMARSRTEEAAAAPARPRHAAADPPALLLDVQPLDRGRAARRARPRGRRRDRVLAARAGAAHQTSTWTAIPEDSRVRRGNYFSVRAADRREPAARPRAQRDRPAARPDARADGDRLGSARPAGHLGAARAPAASRSSSRTSRRSTPTTSTPPSSRRSTATRSTAAINIWEQSSKS